MPPDVKDTVKTHESEAELWDRRYSKEGHIWGDGPSPAAEFMLEIVDPILIKNILEMGFGYGRDTKAFLDNGYKVTGVEIAEKGLTEAVRLVGPYIRENRACLILSDFNGAALPHEKFDVFFSNRVVHLLENEEVRKTVDQVYDSLRDGGLIFIAARGDDDFNEQQMIRRNDGMIEYKEDIPDRKGHLIRLWNEARFREFFDDNRFFIHGFEKIIERESKTNPVDSHLLVMIAQKKKPEILALPPLTPHT